MLEQGEKKYYVRGFDGNLEEIRYLDDQEGKNLPIKSIFSINNQVSIAVEASKLSSAMKRKFGLYRGKRKAKHFYRK